MSKQHPDNHSHRITGLLAAPFTPMHADGSIYFEKIPEVVDQLTANGITGIFICGSTGEGPSMTTSERKKTTEAFLAAVAGRLKVFVHVGHNSLSEARDLAMHASRAGADYISATVPTYFKIQTVEMLVECLAHIAEGAPEMPLYYYNIPSLTGVNLDMVAFLEQAIHRLPSLAGIKYTAPFLHDYQACLNLAPKRFQILYGTDEMLLGALATGAEGAIGSTYNFAAPLYHSLWEAFRKGDLREARDHQLKSVEMVRLIVRFGGLRAQKAMMKMTGIDCGPVRLPLQPFTEKEYQALEAGLRQIGFFQWSSRSPLLKDQ
jgi:N-acetylneuraminate lyase